MCPFPCRSISKHRDLTRFATQRIPCIRFFVASYHPAFTPVQCSRHDDDDRTENSVKVCLQHLLNSLYTFKHLVVLLWLSFRSVVVVVVVVVVVLLFCCRLFVVVSVAFVRRRLCCACRGCGVGCFFGQSSLSSCCCVAAVCSPSSLLRA